VDVTRYAISLVVFMVVTAVIVVSAAFALKWRSRRELRPIPVPSAQSFRQRPSQRPEER
jgi:H+/gluconate symporter-like permease